MSGVFLSYSRADRALAEQVINGLRRIGVEVWWDQDMPGVEWQQELEREINTLAAVVVVWTPNSANSDYVRDEARLALHGGKLVNALAGVHSPPFPFDRVNGLPLDGWNGREPHHGWTRLVQTVAALVVGSGGAQEGDIQAALAESEAEFRAKRQARDTAQEAFQEAQARESEAGETAKGARDNFTRAEDQLQRVGEMRASATILGAAQRELDAARTTRDEAEQAQRAAKTKLSEASRALSRAKADFDAMFGDTPIEPPKPKPRASRKPKATDAKTPAGDQIAADTPSTVDDAAAAAETAAAEIALSTPPPPLAPPPPPPVSPPPPPPSGPSSLTTPGRPGLNSTERGLIVVGIIGGALLLLAIVAAVAWAMVQGGGGGGGNTVIASDNSANTALANTSNTGNTTEVSNAPADANSANSQSLSPASSGTQPSASFSVTACNRTDQTLGVAVSYLPVGEQVMWKYIGFYDLAPGACQNLFTTDNETFYMRAEAANNQAWGEGINLCIQHPGPYNFSIKSGDNCPDGAEAVQYSPVTNTTGQDYTWNFNP